MDLKDFVSETIMAVIAGVKDAQLRAEGLGAHVNPGGLMRTTKAIAENSIWDNQTNNIARLVEFDVAVTVEEGTKTQAGAKINVLAGLLDLGTKGSSENKQLAVSRVHFSVPVLFPVSAVATEARKPKKP